MKKGRFANGMMILLIAVIFLGCLAAAGMTLGWFDTAQTASLTRIQGTVELCRDGLVFPVTADTPLRDGDRVICQTGGSATIQIDNTFLTMDEESELDISQCAPFSADILSGEVFAQVQTPITLSFDGSSLSLSQTVAAIHAQSGIVGVFSGSVDTASAMQRLRFVNGERLPAEALTIDSLSDFTLGQLRGKNLCFTDAELDRLAAQRQQALQELLNPTTEPTENSYTEPTAGEETMPTVATVPPTVPTETAPPLPTQPAAEPTEPTQPTTKPTEPTTAPTEPTKPAGGSCTISIRCDTILQNLESLDQSKLEFVPKDGILLPTVQVSFSGGETVFDILKRACDAAGISLEYSYTPVFDSYYIEGIGHIYEKDCGELSGWLYKVNGEFPNYSCSAYPVSDGDTIVFCYSCKGFGSDVGAPGL